MATVESYPVVICPESTRGRTRKPARRLRLRKDLACSSVSIIAGLSIMFLTELKILGPSLVISFIAYALMLVGGIIWLMRIGEIS